MIGQAPSKQNNVPQKRRFPLPTQGEQERRFFHALCYAIGAEKALLQAVLRARIWRGKGFIPYPPKPRFNLTKRQIICFAAALIIGLPLFFLLKDSTGTSLASMAMIAVMLPCFLFAMYEKHGQPLEVVVRNIIRTKFIAPKERPYRTENLYADLERQRKLEKEVSAIAKGTKHKSSRPRRG